jgi:NAD(P)-dependent dehydrogenase (short-subunit alcohol dehydrogenase family)
VTGAARGLGRAIAFALASHGAQVAVNSRSPERADAMVQEIVARRGKAVACPGDLETPGVANSVVEAAVKAFGRLDIVVNNAGGMERPQSPFDSTPAEERDILMRQNFTTAWDVTAAAWPHMVSAGYGRIVLFASPIAIYGAPGFAHYAAAKGAVIGLARTTAVEGAEHGITVNVVNPLADTRAERGDNAWSRWYEASFSADHVAAGIAWLVDERCKVTGEIFAIGGRRVARVYLSEATGYVEDAPLANSKPVADNFDTVFNGAPPRQFSTLAEYMGFMGELYGGPGGF